MKGVVDGNSGVVTLKVYVDETFDKSSYADLEKDIKHDYLLALVENFEPDELIGRGGGRTFIPFDSGNGKMKVEVEIIK